MTGIIEDSGTFWDQHAQRDPLWAILSDPSKVGRTWDVERFFQTGAAEIASLLYQLDSRSIAMRRRSALDFGCGVGRLTQALGPHFDRVLGVDVSPRMITLARKMNRFPQKVSYTANQAADLRVLDDAEFDFIVSNLVLQHLRPESTLRYLDEFFRVLTPGGVLVFQLPSHKRGPKDGPAPRPVRAMPDDAYRASLVVRGIPGVALRPATEVTLEVEVTNRSAIEWSQQAFGAISVGDHWLDQDGDRMLRRDDGRTTLPEPLRPGDTRRLPLTITAPPDAGRYQCEIDLAHEGVVWFRDKGSPTVRFAVHVARRDDAGRGRGCEQPVAPTHQASQPIAAPSRPAAEVPGVGAMQKAVTDPGDFPMHGVHRDTVVALVARHGATLHHTEDDRSCGQDWVSFRYFVSNRA